LRALAPRARALGPLPPGVDGVPLPRDADERALALAHLHLRGARVRASGRRLRRARVRAHAADLLPLAARLLRRADRLDDDARHVLLLALADRRALGDLDGARLRPGARDQAQRLAAAAHLPGPLPLRDRDRAARAPRQVVGRPARARLSDRGPADPRLDRAPARRAAAGLAHAALALRDADPRSAHLRRALALALVRHAERRHGGPEQRALGRQRAAAV